MIDGPTSAEYRTHKVYASLADLVADAATCGTKYAKENCEWTYGRTFKDRAATMAALADGRCTPLVSAATEAARASLEVCMDPSELIGVSSRRRRVWSDNGEPDVDRVLADRELWAADSLRGKQARTVRLGMNRAVSAGNSEQDVANLVGTVCAISDVLNKLGYPTEIIGMWAAKCSGRRGSYCYSFVLKGGSEPLDLERVGSFGIPGLQRDLLFSLGDRDLGDDGWNGPVRIDETELREITGVDYLAARAWTGDNQATLIQGITELVK